MNSDYVYFSDLMALYTKGDLVTMTKSRMINVMLQAFLCVYETICRRNGFDFVTDFDSPLTIHEVEMELTRYHQRQRTVNLSNAMFLEDEVSPAIKEILSTIILYELNREGHAPYVLKSVRTFTSHLIVMTLVDGDRDSIYEYVPHFLSWMANKRRKFKGRDTWSSQFLNLINQDQEIEVKLDEDSHINLKLGYAIDGDKFAIEMTAMYMVRVGPTSHSSCGDYYDFDVTTHDLLRTVKTGGIWL